MKNDEIPIYLMGLRCQLFRVTLPFDGFDKTNLEHFSYIHDFAKIQRRRLNKAGEPVLYTSSYPNIAERETIQDDTKEFYLVKFRKTGNYEFKCFVAIDDNCSNDKRSHSRIAREAIKQHFSEEELKQIDKLRLTLEKDYNEISEQEKYQESSELASKIFEVADCILTYSRADDGQNETPIGQESNRFLNVTFNKLATDEHLRIESIYHCQPKNKCCLFYEILEIGIPDEQYKSIIWYDWDFDIYNVKTKQGYILSLNSFQTKLHNQGIKLMPNVCSNINDTHIQNIKLHSNETYNVEFEVQLHKK